MNAFLLSLGIALVTLLTGALAAPFFIDWSTQRHFFETHAAEVLGRPVEFVGPMEVRLVPFPRMTVDEVRIGDPQGPREGIERVSIRAALTPLLSGELEISEIVLTRPRITLALSADGEISWAAESGERILPLPADRTRLRRLEIVGGTVVLDGAFGGRQREITDINVTGSAGSLAGPFRLEGAGVVDGERLALRVGTGRLREDGEMRFTASVAPTDRPFTLELDGALELEAGHGTRYRGRAVVVQPGDDERLTPWRIEGDVTATTREVSIGQLAVTIGPETERFALTGTGSIDLAGQPRFDMALATRQLDFDRAYGGGADDPVAPAVALSRLDDLLQATAHLSTGRLSLDVGSVVLAGNLVENVIADLELDSSGWRIAEARAQGPGLTDAVFSGVIERFNGHSTLAGRLEVETRQARTLAAWLFGPDEHVPGLGAIAGHIRAETELSVGPDLLRFGELEIDAADTRLAGEFVYSSEPHSERPELVIRVETDRLSLDGARRATGAASISDFFVMLGGTDIDFALEAGVVQAGSLDFDDVTFVAAQSGGELRVDRLRIGDLGGARIDGYGKFADVATAPAGNLKLDVDASSLESVAALLAELGLSEAGQTLAARAAPLAPLNLAVSIDAAQINEGISRAEVVLAGSAGGTELDAAIRFEGGIDDFLAGDVRIAIEAANRDGHRLLEQVGMFRSAGSQSEGRIDLTARGRPDTAMQFSLEASGPGAAGRSQGDLRINPRGGRELSGSFATTLTEPGALLKAAGVELPPDSDLPLEVTGRLSATDSVWRLSDLVASAGEGDARGSISLDFEGAEPIVDGTLELTSLDLTWLLSVLLGPDAFLPVSDGGGEAWPKTTFSPLDSSGLRGRLRLSTPHLALGGGASARRASLDLRLAPGRYGMENLRANMLGGSISGELELAMLQGALQLEGQVDVDRLRLEELGWRDGDRALAAGVLSASAELSASGHSLLDLVSTLAGGGSIRVEDGAIRHMNARAFERIVEAVDAGLELEEEDIRAAFKSHFDAGSLRFQRAEGSFSLTNGVAQTRNVRLEGAPVGTFVAAAIDLATLQLESQWSLQAEAPDLDGRTKDVDVVFSGPIEAPQRTIDVSPLLGYLTIRAYEREVERLEELQSEMGRRESRRHELTRFNREQERYDRERDDRLRRAEDEAQQGEETAEGEEDDAAHPATAQQLPLGPIVEEPAPQEPELSPGEFEQLIRDALGAPSDEAELETPPPAIEVPTSRPMNIVPPFVGAGGAPNVPQP